MKFEKAWKLYLRFSRLWFTPCNKCQEKIQEDFTNTLEERGFFGIADYAKHVLYYVLCKRCKKKLFRDLEGTEVIIGNRKYEPLIEISRIEI